MTGLIFSEGLVYIKVVHRKLFMTISCLVSLM